MNIWKFCDNIDFFSRWWDNIEAQKFFDILQWSQSCIFLTWKAWSWKSTLIQDVISFYKNQNEYPLILWSTWISALNIWWQTVHSFFSLWIDDVYFKEIQYYIKDKKQKKYKLKKNKRQQLVQAPFVVIDEISMLSSNVLDSIDFLMRFYMAFETKNKDLAKIPFWWKKIIFVWDIYQLPPVKTDKWTEKFSDIYDSEWFFDSNVFTRVVEKNLWKTVELKKNYRQRKDKKFSEILDSIRDGSISEEDISLINLQKNIKSIDENILLSTHRYKVDNENSTQLAKLPWDEKIFYSFVDWIYPDYMKRTDDELKLKIWAKVMMLTNEPCWYWVNWSIWTIVSFDDEIIYVKVNWNVYPIWIYTWENKNVNIDNDWNITEKIIWTYTQYPLKLAYAITIHKSQWMTFDNCRLDISNVFTWWQTYTALSRAKSLSWISLSSNIKIKDLFFDTRIKDFVQKYMW